MKLKILLTLTASAYALSSFGQQPKYTPKSFARALNSKDLKNEKLVKNGFQKSYIVNKSVGIMDLDDNKTTYVKFGTEALLCFEGEKKNDKREGVYNVYLIDSLDHSIRYRIWQQTFKNDKLNGPWLTYTISGTLANSQNFTNNNLDGISRYFWIDGKTVMSETEYFGDSTKFVERTFFQNGKVESETPYDHGNVTGKAKKYYENGALKDEAALKNGQFDGTRKYFYPNGQLWIEQIYRDGKSWTVVGNYTDKGVKRDAGTLKDGNGTVIFYNEDGSVRETVKFINGDAL
jgi:antitoxin component YwqK of YwqJK toxin-antitoxin module